MLSCVLSGATLGLDSVLIEVEVDLPKGGFPGFAIVGLPGKAIKESCERVRSAIKNSGLPSRIRKLSSILHLLIYLKMEPSTICPSLSGSLPLMVRLRLICLKV